jgi:hypothetical protein
MPKDKTKRRITFWNTDVGCMSDRVKEILADPEKAKELVNKIRKQIKKI